MEEKQNFTRAFANESRIKKRIVSSLLRKQEDDGETRETEQLET